MMRRIERAWGPPGWSGAVALGLLIGAGAAIAFAITRTTIVALGVAAVVAVVAGSVIASGVLDPLIVRSGQRTGQRPDAFPGPRPDDRVAALAEQVIGSLDGIEHRWVELGAPWPQLSVGPSGVVVIDVCGMRGPIALDADGVRGQDELGRSCPRCASAVAASDAARRALAPAELDVPVRTITVVAAGTSVCISDDAPSDLWVVAVDELADALARGPVLAMPVVEASFDLLNRTGVVPELN